MTNAEVGQVRRVRFEDSSRSIQMTSNTLHGVGRMLSGDLVEIISIDPDQLQCEVKKVTYQKKSKKFSDEFTIATGLKVNISSLMNNSQSREEYKAEMKQYLGLDI